MASRRGLPFKKRGWSYHFTYRTIYTAKNFTRKLSRGAFFSSVSFSLSYTPPFLPLPTNRGGLLIVATKGELRTAVRDKNRSTNSRTSIPLSPPPYLSTPPHPYPSSNKKRISASELRSLRRGPFDARSGSNLTGADVLREGGGMCNRIIRRYYAKINVSEYRMCKCKFVIHWLSVSGYL